MDAGVSGFIDAALLHQLGGHQPAALGADHADIGRFAFEQVRQSDRVQICAACGHDDVGLAVNGCLVSDLIHLQVEILVRAGDVFGGTKFGVVFDDQNAESQPFGEMHNGFADMPRADQHQGWVR